MLAVPAAFIGEYGGIPPGRPPCHLSAEGHVTTGGGGDSETSDGLETRPPELQLEKYSGSTRSTRYRQKT